MLAEKYLYSKTTKFGDAELSQQFFRVRHCPICDSKKQRCIRVETNGVTTSYICKHNSSGKEINTKIGVSYVHDVNALDKVVNLKPSFVHQYKQEALSEEDIALRGNVYSKFRELVKRFTGEFINSRDKEDLYRRGLNDRQIERMKIFSCPDYQLNTHHDGYSCKVSTAISKELYKSFGDKLTKVPGFIVREDKKGNEFITYKTVKGYFVPYCDLFGNIIAAQYRLTEKIITKSGKELRYLWYSSEEASSSSPCDYYIPSKITRSDIILITEGSLKGKISSEKLGFKGLYIAGVGNYNTLLKTIDELEELYSTRFKYIVAYDMDKYHNADVLNAEKNLISALKKRGSQVAIATWNETDKGIDDALFNVQKLSYILA